MSLEPRMLSVGTANPPQRYTQADLLERFHIADPRVRSLFQSGHIRTRHLVLPEPSADGTAVETQGQLLQKHLRTSLEIGPAAIDGAVAALDLRREDIDALMVVSTTGFLAPGLSAHLGRHMGLRRDLVRTDVVGMGCNAGLNALAQVSAWAKANPGKTAVLACVEVCSAAYVFDGSVRTSVVNSLFGDGAAAVVVRADAADEPRFAPKVLGFCSHQIHEAIGAMRYDWDEDAAKFSFFLDPDIPYVVGAAAPIPVGTLLSRFGLRRRDIAHWIVHSGGKKVVDAVQYNLGLVAHDVRHTASVLRDYGNLSSGSFLFSYDRLLDEGTVRRGEFGVMMTMGPGSQIETALVRW